MAFLDAFRNMDGEWLVVTWNLAILGRYGLW